MKKLHLVCALFAYASSMHSATVCAALIVYSDRSIFENNLATLTTETFENLADPGGVFSTTDVSGLTIGNVAYTGQFSTGGFNYIAVVDSLFAPSLYNRGTGAVIHAPDQGWMTMHLPAGVNAIGADFSTINRSAVDMTIEFSTGDSSTVFSGDPWSFAGFISDADIDWVRFGNVSDFPLMDNFTYGTSVPVPPALWLFGSGLLGLIGMARRKKA